MKINLKRKGFTWLSHPHQSPSPRKVRVGTQGRELDTGAEAGVMVDLYLHSWLAGSGSAHFLIQPGTNLEPPAQGQHCPEWAWPSHIKKILHRITSRVI